MPSGKYERKANWKPDNYREVSWYVSDNGCWICNSHRKNQQSGYHEMNRNGKMIKIHRYMYEKYHGSIPEGLLVCHKCDNKSCINPEHLFVGTSKDNTQDMMKKGRHKPNNIRGEMMGTAKLKNNQVISIRADKRMIKDIAKEYGISIAQISKIRRGECWGHLA
jgi:hypothetical protein